MEGDPKFETTQTIPDFNYAAYAEQLGFLGIRVESPDDLQGAWTAALAADRPALIEAITDPEVSPFPDHVLLKNAEKLAKSVTKGDDAVLKHTGDIVQNRIEESMEHSRWNTLVMSG
mgnify:FL=1